MRTVSRTSGHFAGVHFGLVSLKISLLVHVIFSSALVPVFFSIHSCSLKITFGYVPGFVSTFSRSCRISESFSALTLSGACAFTLSLGLIERLDRFVVGMTFVHLRLEILV